MKRNIGWNCCIKRIVEDAFEFWRWDVTKLLTRIVKTTTEKANEGL